MKRARAALDWKPDQELWLGLNGVRLEARCWGSSPKDAPTVVLLHEGLGSVGLWRDFPERLAEATGWGVFAYSRSGYGASDPDPIPWPLDYMTIQGRDVLPKVLEAIGVQRAVLLGHSDGGTIAALHQGLVRDPRVRGMILMAPHFFVEECSVAAITAAGKAYPNMLRDKLARHHAHVDCAFFGWHDSWLAPGFRDWDVSETIDHWQHPVLAIQGVDDPYGTRAQVDVISERAYCPADVHLLQECQHAPHLEQPEQTTALIQDFLTRLDRIDQAPSPLKS